MRRALWVLALIVGCSVAWVTSAEDIGWQEAVARLKQERTLAEKCVALLKRHGDADAIERGRLAYADAKAEYDAIIAGLDVALAQGDQPHSLPDLEARLRHGFDKRQAFCASVEPLVPKPPSGVKGPFTDIIGGVIGPVADAVKAIWLHKLDDDALRRKTIETQLEDTKWPPFASVSPSS
jgi:hypothetical protein